MVPPLSAENRESAIMLLLDEDEKPPLFPVVCIGGSAGSLSAFVDILSQMPANAGVSIVIVSHRGIGDSDRLMKLLAKATQLDVVEVTDGISLKPGCIFVAPAHREVTTNGLALRLAVGLTENHGWPTLISDFIFSMARMCTSRAIAIIVSGMGYDGSSALAAVKKAGGWTLAQSDASHGDMPQAAIETNSVDLILPAKEIGKYLASLSEHLHSVHA